MIAFLNEDSLNRKTYSDSQNQIGVGELEIGSLIVGVNHELCTNTKVEANRKIIKVSEIIVGEVNQIRRMGARLLVNIVLMKADKVTKSDITINVKVNTTTACAEHKLVEMKVWRVIKHD